MRLATNDSAVQVQGFEQLRMIARELAEDGARERDDRLDGARACAGESACASASGGSRRYGYPPDKQEKATQAVLEQAELWSEEWTASYQHTGTLLGALLVAISSLVRMSWQGVLTFCLM